MGACGEHEGMDKAAYSAHIKDHATKLKDKIAEKAADTVLQDATNVQDVVEQIRSNKSTEAQNEIIRGGGDLRNFTPPEVPADHGYQWICEDAPSWKKMIDDYKTNYKINLLTFNATDRDDAESQLKNTHLTWIVEKFTGLADSFPDPKKGETPLNDLNATCGEGELIKISGNEKAGQSNVSVNEAIHPGMGMLGSSTFGLVSTIQQDCSGWQAATAESFTKQFVPRIPTAVSNQIAAVRAVRNLLAAHTGIVGLARKDVDGLVHDGMTAVEKYDDCCNGGDKVPAWLAVVAGVGAVIAGIVALPLAGGGSLAIAAGAGILASSMAVWKDTHELENAEGQRKKELNLGGSSLEDTVDKIMDAVDEVGTELNKGYTEISGGFDKVVSIIEGKPVEYEAPKPNDAFLDATPGNVRDVTEAN